MRNASIPTMAKPETTLNNKLPQQLVILAGVFMALGALALGQTIYSFFTLDGREIDFMILFLAAGYGLIKLKPYWRLFTLTISVFVLIFTLAPLIIALVSWSRPYPQGLPVGTQVIFWVKTIVSIGASGWALFVLQQPKVASLFKR